MKRSDAQCGSGCRKRWRRRRAPAPSLHRVHVDDQLGRPVVVLAVAEHLASAGGDARITVVCIGTDRSTGDALGPLVGARLAKRAGKDVQVLGTLDEPVHAANLHEVLRELYEHPSAPPRHRHRRRRVPGQERKRRLHFGQAGPAPPRAPASTKLAPVGRFHVMGIVNVGGFMEYFVLQNTRLSLVMRMARSSRTA